jgi:hypothetical protein
MTTGNFTSWRELEIMSPYRPPTMTRLKHPIFVTDGGDFLPFSKHFFGFPMRG